MGSVRIDHVSLPRVQANGLHKTNPHAAFNDHLNMNVGEAKAVTPTLDSSSEKLITIDPKESYNKFYTQSSLQSLKTEETATEKTALVEVKGNEVVPVDDEQAQKAEEEEAAKETKVKKDNSILVQIGNFASWFFGCIFGKSDQAADKVDDKIDVNNQGIGNRPKLETPMQMDARFMQKLSNEMKKMNWRTRDVNEDGEDFLKHAKTNDSEVYFYLLLISCMLKQKESRESSGVLLKDDILRKAAENKEMQKAYIKKLESMGTRSFISGILGWVNIGLTACWAGIGVAAVATGGIGAVLAVAAPVLALAQGATLLGEGVLKYQNSKQEGEITELKYLRQDNHEKMQSGLDKMQVSQEHVAGYFRNLRQVTDNQRSAARSS